MITSHRPRKRFGQHFLHDRGVLARIVAAIAPKPGERIVEIGPGPGALTAPLIAAAGHIDAIEIDRDLARGLRARFTEVELTLFEADVLEFDFGRLGTDLRLVGNLPYNISTPLLFHLARFADRIRDAHFMLQREVVERIVAAPGGAAYGRLSVMLGARFDPVSLLRVPAGAFQPPPKVESAVVRLVPRATPAMPPELEPAFADVVRAAFSHRRKTLRNALAGLVTADDLVRLGVDPGARPETLGVAEYARIAARIGRIIPLAS